MWNFLRTDFSIFWLGEPKCSDNLSKKDTFVNQNNYGPWLLSMRDNLTRPPSTKSSNSSVHGGQEDIDVREDRRTEGAATHSKKLSPEDNL